MKQNIMKALLTFTAIALLAGGIYLQQQHIGDRAAEATQRKRLENQQAMLAQLKDSPLFSWQPTDWSLHEPRVAKDYARAAEEAGIDVFACYLLTEPDSPIKASLAYILVASQDQKYLQQAAENLQQISAAEVQLWVSLVETEPDPALPATLIKQLKALAMDSPTAPGLYLAAGQYYTAGLTEDAATYWKQLIESESVQGLAAAEKLIDSGIEVPAATAYLWRIAQAQPKDELAAEAIGRLVRIHHADTWIEAKRYRADPSAVNAAALLAKLKAAGPQSG
ncbi:MAG: hypothetical protein ACLFUJ_08410 [Phycisphaerae bacterium]